MHNQTHPDARPVGVERHLVREKACHPICTHSSSSLRQVPQQPTNECRQQRQFGHILPHRSALLRGRRSRCARSARPARRTGRILPVWRVALVVWQGLDR